MQLLQWVCGKGNWLYNCNSGFVARVTGYTIVTVGLWEGELVIQL